MQFMYANSAEWARHEHCTRIYEHCIYKHYTVCHNEFGLDSILDKSDGRESYLKPNLTLLLWEYSTGPQNKVCACYIFTYQHHFGIHFFLRVSFNTVY